MWIIGGMEWEEINESWRQIAMLVARALRNGGSLENTDSIYDALMHKRMQLWGIKWNGELRGCIITEIEHCDLTAVLRVVALTGEGMKEWLFELERTLRVFGAAHGCRYLSLEGRQGWMKALKEFNWRVVSIKMFKEL